MRRWREADREPFAAINADPEVMRYFPAPLDRAASDAMVDRIEDLFRRQGFGLWALETASTADAAPELASTELASTELASTELANTGLASTGLASTGEFIGFTGLNPMPDGVPGAGGMEVGWRLARHAWHQGYATEAAAASASVAFQGPAWRSCGPSRRS